MSLHIFTVTWDPDDHVWLVEHTSRKDVFTYGTDLAEARRHALEVLALALDVDEEAVGEVRFDVRGPVRVV